MNSTSISPHDLFLLYLYFYALMYSYHSLRLIVIPQLTQYLLLVKYTANYHDLYSVKCCDDTMTYIEFSPDELAKRQPLLGGISSWKIGV